MIEPIYPVDDSTNLPEICKIEPNLPEICLTDEEESTNGQTAADSDPPPLILKLPANINIHM